MLNGTFGGVQLHRIAVKVIETFKVGIGVGLKEFTGLFFREEDESLSVFDFVGQEGKGFVALKFVNEIDQ